MDAKKLRSWWFHRQGLDGRLRGESASKVLGDTGWARSVGSAAPYLTLFSRGRLSRKAADAAVARLEIHELPSARGCTYAVPACDFALALKAASGFGDSDLKVAYKLGVTDKEIGKLCEAVVKALDKGPLDPEQIREATGRHRAASAKKEKRRGLPPPCPWRSASCKPRAKSGVCR